MAVQVTVDTGSKRDAELIAAALPGEPAAASWRGYGVVRLRVRSERDARDLLPFVSDSVVEHGLAWARVRIGDDEHMFRASRIRAS
jgi:hypothetical protein